MNLKNLKIKTKLAIGFAVVIIISATIGIIGIYRITNIKKSNERTLDAVFFNESFLNVRIIEKNFMLRHDEALIKDGVSIMENVFKKIEDLKANTKDQDELKDLEEIKDKGKKFYDTFFKYLKIYKEDFATNVEKSVEEKQISIKKIRLLRASLNEQMLSELKNNGASDLAIKYNIVNNQVNNISEAFTEIRIKSKEFINNQDKKQGDEIIEDLDALLKKIDKVKSQVKLKEDLKQLEEIYSSVGNYKNIVKNLSAAIVLQKQEANKMETSAQNMVKTTENIKKYNETLIKQEQKSANFMIITFILLGIVFGFLIAYIITKSITTGIQKSVAFANKLAEGDLTAEIEDDLLKQKDEIGMVANAFNNIILKLREMINDIKEGSENILAASEQMSSTSQEMSQGASEQASSTEEVSSSMEEMAANIQQNTDNAQQTEKIANSGSQEIINVNKAFEESLISIREIAEKISIIDEIAFQTNILALNAAVEAARAGEYGKGFAVVASEVRKLAERSKTAAQEIDVLSKSSLAVTEKSGNLMKKIIPEVDKTAKLVQEITAASIEQNSGADQINNAIQQLNQVVQQNAAASEEIATGSEELSSQAQQLVDVVSFFKVNNDNKKIRMAAKKKTKKTQHINIAHNTHNENLNKGVHLNMYKDDKKDDEFEKF